MPISNSTKASADQFVKLKPPEQGASKTELATYKFCRRLSEANAKRTSSNQSTSQLFLRLNKISGDRANQLATLIGGLAKKTQQEAFGKLALQGDPNCYVSSAIISKAVDQLLKQVRNPQTQDCLKLLKSSLYPDHSMKTAYADFKREHERVAKQLEFFVEEGIDKSKKTQTGRQVLQGDPYHRVPDKILDQAIELLFQKLAKERLEAKTKDPIETLKKEIAACTKNPLKKEEIEKILRVAKKYFPQSKAIKLDRKQNKIARTLLLNSKMTAILMTRCRTKGDKLVGKGGFKRIKYAVTETGQRKIVGVSRRTKKMSSAAWNGLAKEDSIMEKCKGMRGVIQLDFAMATEKKYYMVMENCNGGDLHGAIGKNKLSFEEKLTIALDSAEGMKNLHEKKIFHRDLYPKNIFLICKEGKVVQAKVADLGMATTLGDVEDPNSGLFDWPSPWFSPEQAQAKIFKGSKGEKAKRWLPVSNDKSDVWALGLTFFRLFNPKRKGFSCQGEGLPKESNEDKAKRITRVTNAKLEKEVLESGIHPEIGQLILKMVRVKPEERVSMEKAYQTLQEIIKNTPVLKQ